MRPSRSCSPCRSCYGTGPDNGPRSSESRPCGDSSDPAGDGYTGAAGWMFRQTLEGVLGLRLSGGRIIPPPDPAPPGGLARAEITRDPARSPLPAPTHLRQGVQHIAIGPPTRPA